MFTTKSSNYENDYKYMNNFDVTVMYNTDMKTIISLFIFPL